MSNDPLAEFLMNRAIQEENRRTAERQRREAQEAEEARAYANRVGIARQHVGRYNEVIQEASRWLTDEEVRPQRRRLLYLPHDVTSNPSGVAETADLLKEVLEEDIQKAKNKAEKRERHERELREEREASHSAFDVFLTQESLRGQLQKELAEVDLEATLYVIRYPGPSSGTIAEAYKRFVKEMLVKSYNSKLREKLKDNPYQFMARNFTL